MIDEDTRFMVASHISNTRTFEDTVSIFKKELNKARLDHEQFLLTVAMFTKVHSTKFSIPCEKTQELIGTESWHTARETNNLVERLHCTLKDRTRCMRGLHSYESTKLLLEGWSVHYNCVRPHQSLGGKTPAQAARMEVPNNWKGLIDEATKYEAQLLVNATNTNTQTIKQALEVKV